jgi:hypothetical protein
MRFGRLIFTAATISLLARGAYAMVSPPPPLLEKDLAATSAVVVTIKSHDGCSRSLSSPGTGASAAHTDGGRTER